MGQYRPPLRDIRFVTAELLGIHSFLKNRDESGIDIDTVRQVLDAAGQFAAEVIYPLNKVGDVEGCRRTADGIVHTPAGFKKAFDQYVAAGWPTLSCDPAYEGQGFPLVISNAVFEMLCGANMAWAAYPAMSAASYKCLAATGSQKQKDTYLSRIATGQWAGTMCLTEPNAGTDLGLLRTKAIPLEDGSYAITGTKIFISGGEQDLTENIVHLVLARVQGAPPGVKGISLFIVPKHLPDAQGAPGMRNSLSCGSLEEKMGIHGNSTCTMNFDDAKGWLLGEENKGLAGMFVMMNTARIAVAVSAVGLMEVAYQSALTYANERRQGRSHIVRSDPQQQLSADPISNHADVRRMLLTQKAYVEGCRALVLWATQLADTAHDNGTNTASDLLALVTPVVKAFVSDLAVECTNLAVQVFGGHGYIRENGVEQYVRDARIIPLYEGANGIQAMDLIQRKVLADKGQRLGLLATAIQSFIDEHESSPGMHEFSVPLSDLLKTVMNVTETVVNQASLDADAGGAAATPYLRLMGHLLLAWLWARMAAVAMRQGGSTDGIYLTKISTARYYYRRLMPETRALVEIISAGPGTLVALDTDIA